MARRIRSMLVFALLLVIGAVGVWLAIPSHPLDPSLPELGPGARRVGGSARIGAPVDAATR